MHGMVYETCGVEGALGRKQKEDTNGYQRRERMLTPDKTPIQATRTIAARRTSAHSEHGKYDVLWWTCYEEQCTEHHPMKERNGNEIRIQCIITTRDTIFIDGYDMKDLQERSGTFGTAKESS
jgi:hypothetical protein